MRSKPALWKNLVLSLISLLVGIGLCELIVRSFVPVRNVGPSFFEYDRFYGRAFKKSSCVRRITPEFTMTFTTNSDGFRGPELGNLSSRPILFLGDSFTMGYGVNDGEEFPALIRKALEERGSEKAFVINAGIGGSGNGRWVKFLRTKGKIYDPILILLQIHGNDFQDNIRERLFELTPTGELNELPVPPPGMKWVLRRFLDFVPGLANSYLRGLTRQLSWGWNASRQDSASENPLEEQLLFRLLEEVLTICEKRGWNILTVLSGLSERRLAELKTFFWFHHIPTIVIPGKCKRPDLYYKVDEHWNARGHRFAADRILAAIQDLDLRY